MAVSRQPLGRGLDAILGGAARPAEPVAERPPVAAPMTPPVREADRSPAAADGTGSVLMVPIERIVAGRGQPRRKFDETALEELAQSIREQGLIQPLVVVRRTGGFELVAGERRLRASARAGLERVPVVIRESAGEPELLELALVENLQREDLSPLERARAYERLMETHGYTQDQVAQKVGKSRPAIANTIRLLGLPQPVLDALDQGLVSEGHARSLLALPTMAAQIDCLRVVVRKGLSVRETEELVKARLGESGGSTRNRREARPSGELETRLGRRFGTKVRIRGSQNRGRIEIDFYSQDELARLMELLGG
jgi:ParB family chromosome partitioning protein